METTEKTIEKIIIEINKEKLLLPHFQREFDWKPDKQKSLIASFLYNVPIGSILFLEIETDMLTKTIGNKIPDQPRVRSRRHITV